MPSRDMPGRVGATAELLVSLLANRPRYVRTWQVHGDRFHGQVNQRAVARVVALYLWETGAADDTDTGLPARLKNQIFRAFSGKRLTGELLASLIAAFDMDEDDEAALWAVFAGGLAIENTVTRHRAMGKRQWHHTVALFENWYVTTDESLIRRHVIQCIEAREDGVDSYLFNRGPQVTRIDVIHGGTIGRHYEYGGGLVSDDIVLDTPLVAGERAAIEYQAYYTPGFRPTEIRRPARGRTDNVTVSVHFTKTHQPARVWFAVWADHYLGDPTSQEQASISSTGGVSRSLRHIEQTVVGFRWQW